MRLLQTLVGYLLSTLVLVVASTNRCKCTPNDVCWPSTVKWNSLNTTLSGALIRSVPPASVCYPSQPNYNEAQCTIARSQWFNSTWHSQDPISIDYPLWANNSCNPIYANGTSVTGDVNAGSRGCSIGNYPAYIVNATTAKQVSAALKWAEKHNIRVVVKNTGHSYVGRSVGYGSLSIWTHHFRGIKPIDCFKPKSCPINDTQSAVRVAAGHTGAEVLTELSKNNSVVVTGADPNVGIIGWITGGGHGPLSTTYGMGADNLLEAIIVTPKGNILVANPCKNSELFFAIRGGGGGTYGVVLEVVVKTFPSPKTTSHLLLIGSISPNTTTEFWDLMGYMHSELQRLKEGGIQGYYGIVGPPSAPTLSCYWSFYLYDQPNGTMEALVSPIEQHLKERTALFMYQSTTTTTSTFLETYHTNFEHGLVATQGATYGSWLMSPASLANETITANVLSQIGPSNNAQKPNGIFTNPILLGHIVAPAHPPSYSPSTISTNPAWRNTIVHLIVEESWPDGAPRPLIDAVYQSITYNKTELLRKLSPETGAYFNEPDAYEPGWQKVFFGENYGRLRGIKERFDPGSVMWCRRCVGSEGWVEEGGRLCKVRMEG